MRRPSRYAPPRLAFAKGTADGIPIWRLKAMLADRRACVHGVAILVSPRAAEDSRIQFAPSAGRNMRGPFRSVEADSRGSWKKLTGGRGGNTAGGWNQTIIKRQPPRVLVAVGITGFRLRYFWLEKKCEKCEKNASRGADARGRRAAQAQ